MATVNLLRVDVRSDEPFILEKVLAHYDITVTTDPNDK